MTQKPDMETVYAKILERRRAARALPPYSACSAAYVTDALERFFTINAPGSTVSHIQRMGGGASKEQFRFTLTDTGGRATDYVLRMDPRAAITETDRRREYEILLAIQGLIPAPLPVWLDADGEIFGQPAVIMNMVRGVTKPSGSGVKVSGLGTWLGDELRAKLRGPFLDYLVKLHAFDWRSAHLPSYDAPTADPQQSARWSFNYWREMWHIDDGETRPIFALAEQWLADNLPDCDDLVLTHGDYRTGNYLFDEATGEITAMLDWELGRIGDYHEDLAWVLMQVFGTWDNGVFRVSDLYERDEFITAYEQASGRIVNRATLHFYDVFSSWKTYCIVAANGLAAARNQHNHQDVLLTFLATTSAMFADDLVRLLSMGDAQ